MSATQSTATSEPAATIVSRPGLEGFDSSPDLGGLNVALPPRQLWALLLLQEPFEFAEGALLPLGRTAMEAASLLVRTMRGLIADEGLPGLQSLRRLLRYVDAQVVSESSHRECRS